MATYCIGDLHGRDDLFEMLLDKINFNPEKDKVYILGDVIDHNYGAVKVLNKIDDSNGALVLLKGNHEKHFLSLKKRYIDFFMKDEKLKSKILILINNTVEAVRELEKAVVDTLDEIPKKKKHLFKEKLLNKKEVIKWADKSKQRKVFLETIIKIADENNYDDNLLKNIFSFVLSSLGQFKHKPFLKEIFELDNEKYLKICNVIENGVDVVELEINERKFVLKHIVGASNSCSPIPVHWNTDINNVYYVFGHEPVANIHKNISDSFDFNYREILSYKDCLNRYYFNLDMTSNVAAALRLDDLEEFYVMKYKGSQRNKVFPPEETATERKQGYRKSFESGDDYILITYDNHCIEYIIKVYTESKTLKITTLDLTAMNLIMEIKLGRTPLSEDKIIERTKKEMNKISKDREELLRGYIPNGGFFIQAEIQRYIKGKYTEVMEKKEIEAIDDEIIYAVISLIKKGVLVVKNKITNDKIEFTTIDSFIHFLCTEIFPLNKKLAFKLDGEHKRPKFYIS